MIHKYKLNGYNMVLDVNSGAIHSLDDCAFDILNFFECQEVKSIDQENLDSVLSENSNKAAKLFNDITKKYQLSEIKEAYDELKQLFDSGLLFSKDINYSNLEDKFSSENTAIKSMCLNVSHDCNLRCEYCFAAKGNFGGKRELMPIDVAKNAIDFLIEHSGNRHNLELDFFGGEPLMNFDVVKETVKYARSIEKSYNKNFRFTITTNGLLLDDEKINFINQEMSNCVLSIDGRKEVNDRLRVTPAGTGSYDIIVPKFQKLVKDRKNKNYYVRGTFTANNLDFSEDVFHLFSLGFDQISVEPVVSDKKLSYSIKEEHLDRVFQEYEILSKKIIECNKNGKKINFFHFMLDLDSSPCLIKKIKGCGCGNEYIAVAPSGEIYPCHQFVGNKSWIMGNVNNKTFSKEIKFYFSKANIFNKSKCKNCFAKYFCSGGCNANNFNYEGSVFTSHELSCQLMRKRLECALMIKAAELDKYTKNNSATVKK